MGIFSDWFREVLLGIEEEETSKPISNAKKTKSPAKKSKKTEKQKKSSKPLARTKKVDSLGSRKTVGKFRKKVTKKISKTKKETKKKTKKNPPVTKFEGNPIIVPSEKNRWESKATFNPAALHAEGKIHLLYRAMGDGDVSVLGYMSSEDGFTMSNRLEHPAYFVSNTHGRCKKGRLSRVPPISYVSGGGLNGGAEDPRMTLIDDIVYLTYTAFDGWGSVRMAISSIPLKDFLKKKWDWKKPVMISPPGEIHKNWTLFPEKINGKFAVLHSISPDVLVDYFDDLNFEKGNHIESHYNGRVNKKNRWDDWVRGAGPPPIKTKEGWLLIYHAMDSDDPDRYKMGAMLLDLKNPSKIIARANEPILEPDMYYENEGSKAGVVYCCGAVIKDKRLFIYYGGSDDVSCVATADLDKFLKILKKTGKPKVKKASKIANSQKPIADRKR